MPQAVGPSRERLSWCRSGKRRRWKGSCRLWVCFGEETEKRFRLILRDGGKICSGEWDGGRRIGIIGLSRALLACVRLQVPHWRIRRREGYWRRRHDCCCVIIAMRFRSCCMSRTDLKTALSTGREARAPRGSGVRTPKMCKLPHGGFHNGNWEAGQGLEASTTSLRAVQKGSARLLLPGAPFGCG